MPQHSFTIVPPAAPGHTRMRPALKYTRDITPFYDTAKYHPEHPGRYLMRGAYPNSPMMMVSYSSDHGWHVGSYVRACTTIEGAYEFAGLVQEFNPEQPQ